MDEYDDERATLRKGRSLRSPNSDTTYRVVALLGAGGFGSVYRCRTVGEDAPDVAVKVTYDQDSWVRELYFAQLLEGVRATLCPSDAFVLGAPRGGGHPVYVSVMQIAEGGDLFDLLYRGVRFSETRALAVARRVLDVLEHLHAGGAMHRDLTPANVFFDDHGNALLSDFGIARHRGRAQGVRADAFNDWYAPPEIAGWSSRWSPVQDIWQVGQLLAVMLAGDPTELVKPGDVRRLPCEEWLREVIYRAVGPVEVRYTSARAMNEALKARRRALDSLPTSRTRTLSGKRLVFTARLPDATRVEAQQRAELAGADVRRSVGFDTDLLVVGDSAPLYAAGSAGSKLLAALALNERGADIRTLSAARFAALT